MLCRVADSLFWMSRYIERADNTVRLVEVNLQLLLEAQELGDAGLQAHWEPILFSTGDLGAFNELYPEVTSHNVTDYLTFNRDNPSSVYSCILYARENARMIRDQISAEMWEIINRLYLYLKKQDPDIIWKEGTNDFYNQLKEFAILFQGITESTMLHRIGYEFQKAGRFLERADKISRILDIKYYMGKHQPSVDGGVIDVAQWVSILRACGGADAYHQVYTTDVIPDKVAEFLILSRDFPRSLLYCLNQLQLAIHAISKCPISHYSNDVERFCGRLINDLNYTNIQEIKECTIHKFLTDVHKQISEIAIAFNERYMFFPIVDPNEEDEAVELPRQSQSSS